MADPEPPDPPREPLSPEQIAELQAIADAIPRGKDGQDALKQLTWLVEVLIQRGQLPKAHYTMIRRLKADMTPARVQLMTVDDKRSVPSPDVDCAALMHLCRARCCSMDVKLSEEDIREGKLRWRLDEPYLLERNPEHGFCFHLQKDGGCGVYDDRPAACRVYDCRNDKRIWEDFEKGIPTVPPFFVEPFVEAKKPDP